MSENDKIIYMSIFYCYGVKFSLEQHFKFKFLTADWPFEPVSEEQWSGEKYPTFCILIRSPVHWVNNRLTSDNMVCNGKQRGNRTGRNEQNTVILSVSAHTFFAVQCFAIGISNRTSGHQLKTTNTRKPRHPKCLRHSKWLAGGLRQMYEF